MYRPDIKTIYIDFDNTIVDTIKTIVSLYNEDFEYYKKFHHVNWWEIDSYDFKELTCTSKEYINTYFNTPRFFYELEFMPDAHEIIDELGKIYQVKIVSMGYSPNLKQKEQPVVFQDFIKDPVIIREKGSGTKKEMDIFLENAGIEPSSLNVVARMNDLESIKKSIVNGLGFSILSARSVVDLQKTKQILLFPLEESAHKRSFYIVYSKNRILKSHVRQFIHYVKEYYQTV